MGKLSDIQSFLSQKRIAIAGLSRNPRDFSRALYDEFVKRGYDIVGVNPNAMTAEDGKWFGSIAQVVPAPDAVLVLTGKRQTEQVVKDCQKAGVRNVWTFGTDGRGSLSEEVSCECREAGMTIVEGECPFMYFSKSGGIHWFHGVLRKLFHTYPA